ncbi:hypothetical protein [Streptomyces sp. NPDC093225]|uniref:hypothetical protein n=1 Tax=Streptomyces sp. NPDC093225 TaxID=3366034 RepID=UPI00382805FD
MTRGWRALDRKDRAAWAACWAEDAVSGPYDRAFRRDPGQGWLLTRQQLGVWWTDGDAPRDAFAPR